MTCALCPMAGSPTLRPDGSGRIPVMIVSDHMTDADKVGGRALVGRDGAMLARELSRGGWKWEDFYCAASAFCIPSPARAFHATQSCTSFSQHCATVRPKVYLTVGRLALKRLTGLDVAPLLARGYVWPALPAFGGAWVVAALPPSYYRTDPGMLITFRADVAKAVRIAEEGFSYDDTPRCVWEPEGATWHAFVQDFFTDPTRPLAVDVETPWKNRSEQTEEELAGEDISYTLDEVNLSYDGVTGVSVPWDNRYQEGVRAMIAASQAHGMTIFWNAAYDMPRLEHNGIPRFRATHTRDAMDSFRVWRNSVRRKLAVAASLMPSLWNVRPWKHLGTADATYRSMDVIGLWRADRDILQMLEAEGQLAAYHLFVRDLDPLLEAMTDAGVRVDEGRVAALDEETRAWIARVQADMTAVVPPEILTAQTWVKRSSAELGLARLKEATEVLPDAKLFEVPATRTTRVCGHCGAQDIRAEHTKKKTLKPLALVPEPVLG